METTAASTGEQNNNAVAKLSEGENTVESTDALNESSLSNKKRPINVVPITAEGERPQKKFYRQRAHCNPLSHNDSFIYPHFPQCMDWCSEHYPRLAKGTAPTVLDIGCGFGGLTLALAQLLPNSVILGMEIRAKVTEYVRLRIAAKRKEYDEGSQFQNCSVLRTNTMKFLPNFFAKASIEKLFFCFPDPHFKRKNHGRRIISERLLTEYAYVLRPKGRLYCITDVKELHEWHVSACDAHPMFHRLSNDAVVKDDPCVKAMMNETEEGQKVSRQGGDNKKGEKYYAVYERMEPDDPEVLKVDASNFFSTPWNG